MEKLKGQCDIFLSRNETVQGVFGIPSPLSFPLKDIFREPQNQSFQICNKCQAKYNVKCPICTTYEVKEREINLTINLKKSIIPLLIFINVEKAHEVYVTYFLQLLKQYKPEKKVIFAFHHENSIVIKSLNKEIILPTNEWLINHSNYSFSASQLTDDFISSLFQNITPNYDISPILLDICTSTISHICLFTSQSIILPQDIPQFRKKLYHSSSSIDQFVFSISNTTPLSEVISKDSNSHFFAYDQFTISQFPQNALELIQTERLYNLRIVTIIPGFKVDSMTPKSFTYSSDQCLTLFVNSETEHEEKYVQCQTQWYYQLENGDCCQCIINESYLITNKLSELYGSYSASEYIINLAKYTLGKRNDILEDGRINFMKQLTGCMLNYYEMNSLSQFPYNRDALSHFCCHLLNSPAFCGDQVDNENKNKIMTKCVVEREMILQLPTKQLENYFDRELYYVKVVSNEYIQTYNIPYQSERFIGQSWLIQRMNGIAVHLIFRQSQEAKLLFGEEWYEKEEEFLIDIWKQAISTKVSSDPLFFDGKLKRIKNQIKVIEDYGEIIPLCWDGMANLFRDEPLFKINLVKRIEEQKRRNETTYLFPHV